MYVYVKIEREEERGRIRSKGIKESGVLDRSRHKTPTELSDTA
jgi:hypothetical protein